MRVIAGSARGIPLKTPDGMQTRPTADRVKEAMFSIIHFEIPGAAVLDLFGGTGQLGIEALSRGAKSAVFVDAGEPACRLIRENLKATSLTERGRVISGDSMEYLKSIRETFDIIFLDPPYDTMLCDKALQKIFAFDILTQGGIIVCERPLDKELSLEFSGFSRSRD